MTPEKPDSQLEAAVASAARWPALNPPLPREKMPRHVAIIMDGNGRWARQRGLLRVKGHLAGAETVRAITRYAGQIHLQALTLFAFSTENWKRPRAEIRFLFGLLRKHLVRERAELLANGVRLRAIGDTRALPEQVQAELQRTIALTAANSGLNVCLALNYGAQDEILNAVREVAARVAAGEIRQEDITSELLERHLFTAGLPPVDLLIRTAGERRLSNFLLWQACGAEFYVTPQCWPDFRRRDLDAAILEYGRRRKG